MKTLNHKEQTDITRVIIKVATMLLEYGAESLLVEQSASRLGDALGVDSVEIALIPSAIVLTTLYNDHCVTTTRRVYKKEINMSIVCYIQKIVLEVEQKKLGVNFISTALSKANPARYNRWLVIFMVGLSCAAFAHLQRGDLWTLLITFLAASIAMWTRQEIAKKGFAPYINVGITAFVATLIASIALQVSDKPYIALASSVLLLFPGFPFVNSFSDSFKGYLNMGWGRWLQASLLTFSVTIGIILAITLLGIQGF